MVSSARRCFSPTSTITVSRSRANSPALGWVSLAIVATASSWVRLGSTASTIVREAW